MAYVRFPPAMRFKQRVIERLRRHYRFGSGLAAALGRIRRSERSRYLVP